MKTGDHPFGASHDVGPPDPFAHVGHKEGPHHEPPDPMIPHRLHAKQSDQRNDPHRAGNVEIGDRARHGQREPRNSLAA